MQRQKKVAELKASGNVTPITETTFNEWLDRKRKARADAAKKLVEAEMKKKKGGKGLAVLSGRDLYEYKKSLFDAGNDEQDIDTSGMEPDDEDGDDTQQQNGDANVAHVAAKVESDLFLEGDDDLDDLDDLEEDWWAIPINELIKYFKTMPTLAAMNVVLSSI